MRGKGINKDFEIGNFLGGSILKKNMVWNFIGRILPMGVAFFTIPMIVKGLGNERFGLLTMIWMIFGYASIFDMGLGRALTQLISKKLGEDDTGDISDIIWTTLLLVFLIGTAGSLMLYFAAGFITVSILNVSPSFVAETVNSLKFISYCLPAFFLACSLGGVLEAYQKFAIANIVRLPLSLFNYVAPVLIIPFTKNLDSIVLALLFGRVAVLIANFIVCANFIDGFLVRIKIKTEYIKSLISFGGWSTVSNIINPIMITFDRVFISNMISASVVAFYTTPFEVISKLLVVQGCVTSVMFPAFASEIARKGRRRLQLYYKTIKTIFLILIIPVLGIVFGAKWGLSLWINPEFANHSYQIAQVLAVGILINSLASVPFSMIQAYGKSNITALINICELPLYLILIVFFIHSFGIIGAAWAWLLRALIDFVILYFCAYKIDKIESSVN